MKEEDYQSSLSLIITKTQNGISFLLCSYLAMSRSLTQNEKTNINLYNFLVIFDNSKWHLSLTLVTSCNANLVDTSLKGKNVSLPNL